MMLPVRIAGTSHVAPGRAVSTAELVRRLDPPLDAEEIVRKTGIVSRHVADPGPTCATDVGLEAIRLALADADVRAEALERLIFVSSTGGDTITPSNATRIAVGLGLADTCDCFDVSNGCVGFLTAFDLASRSIATGSGPIAIATVEICTRVTTPAEPRPYVIFGDAAAALVLEPGRDGDAVLATWLRNDGIAGGDVHLRNPIATGKLETVFFTTSGQRMGDDAVSYIRRSADAVLARAGVALADVEWVLPHQPNGRLLQRIVDGLGVDPARVVPMVHDVGSVSSVSIPISLDRLRRSGRVRPGDRILMVGVGTGLAYGAVLVRVGG
jgi:3-oxoacyl-[acyl-carrier-protein] synthase III